MKLSEFAKATIKESLSITIMTFPYLYIIKEIFLMRFGEITNSIFIYVYALYYSYLWLTTIIDVVQEWQDTHYN